MNEQRTWRLYAVDRMMLVALATSFGSTCARRATGCVLTKERRVVATGYNGAPPGMYHCIDSQCLTHEGHCINCNHAELNACLQCCGRADTAFCTDEPCLECYRALVQKGVVRIYFWRHYEDARRETFRKHHRSIIPNQVSDQLSDMMAAHHKLIMDMRGTK